MMDHLILIIPALLKTHQETGESSWELPDAAILPEAGDGDTDNAAADGEVGAGADAGDEATGDPLKLKRAQMALLVRSGSGSGKKNALLRAASVDSSRKPQTPPSLTSPKGRAMRASHSGFQLLQTAATELRREAEVGVGGAVWVEYLSAEDGPLFYMRQGSKHGQWNKPEGLFADIPDSAAADVAPPDTPEGLSPEPSQLSLHTDSQVSQTSHMSQVSQKRAQSADAPLECGTGVSPQQSRDSGATPSTRRSSSRASSARRKTVSTSPAASPTGRTSARSPAASPQSSRSRASTAGQKSTAESKTSVASGRRSTSASAHRSPGSAQSRPISRTGSKPTSRPQSTRSTQKQQEEQVTASELVRSPYEAPRRWQDAGVDATSPGGSSGKRSRQLSSARSNSARSVEAAPVTRLDKLLSSPQRSARSTVRSEQQQQHELDRPESMSSATMSPSSPSAYSLSGSRSHHSRLSSPRAAADTTADKTGGLAGALSPGIAAAGAAANEDVDVDPDAHVSARASRISAGTTKSAHASMASFHGHGSTAAADGADGADNPTAADSRNGAAVPLLDLHASVLPPVNTKSRASTPGGGGDASATSPAAAVVAGGGSSAPHSPLLTTATPLQTPAKDRSHEGAPLLRPSTKVPNKGCE